MPQSIKDCRCGRRIPSDWSICAQCERNARLDTLDGSAEQRHFRYTYLKANGWPNRAVKPPLDPETLALLADGVAKQAEMNSILGLRKMNRQIQHEEIRIKGEMYEEEPLDL
jgi:hypothetical protein